jgi:hypothetical protein
MHKRRGQETVALLRGRHYITSNVSAFFVMSVIVYDTVEILKRRVRETSLTRGTCGNYVEVCSLVQVKRLIGEMEERCHI